MGLKEQHVQLARSMALWLGSNPARKKSFEAQSD
jgi:hypothetical protein